MNATTASFLGLRRRQRAQDLLREAPKKAPASQCARVSQKRAIRIAAIAPFMLIALLNLESLHTLYCPSIASKSGSWSGFGDVCPAGPRSVGPDVRIGQRTQPSEVHFVALAF